MKPLTIEELKALEVGDWVWVTDSKGKLGTYARKCVCFGDDNFRYETIEIYEAYYYSDYGTKWLAYKNKEQAECKGEIVELPCTVGKDCYIVKKDKDGDYRMRTLTLTSYKVITGNFVKVFFAKPKRYLMGTYEDLEAEHDTSMLGLYRKEWFTYIKEAERRLAELRGENYD